MCINRLNIDQENCTMKNWYLFEYALKTNDTESISDGKFLLPLFQFLHGEKNYDFCIISNIDGGFDCDKNDQYIHELLANRYGGNVFDFETFVKLVNKILVLDWGDFFFFSSRPDELMLTFKSMSYEDIISETIFTVRFVDSYLIQLFCRDGHIANKIDYLKFKQIQSGRLKDFSYPG